jgi:hypothetical protein
MEETKDVIIFAGDSFTWGEGLELYIPTENWKKEQLLPNGWMELQHKQNSETIQFRETNRFGGIVSKYFNVESKIHPFNGGQFETPINDIERILPQISPKVPKAIIIQFTSINRMLLHLDMDCKCKFCVASGYEKPWNIYLKYIEHLVKGTTPITTLDMFGLEYLRDNHNIPFENIDIDNIFKNIDYMFKDMYYKNLQIYIDKYLKKWMDITPVYFIDSWDWVTSEILSDFPYITDNMISLKGYDGNYYKNYNKWENTFPYTRIVNEFPATQNGHPTLIQHQYLAESIIRTLK